MNRSHTLAPLLAAARSIILGAFLLAPFVLAALLEAAFFGSVGVA